MSNESNDRVLIGAQTYIAGPYHFVKNIPQLVREQHIAYIDSLRTADGEPMFSHVEPELEYIDGEDLAEVGLVDEEPDALDEEVEEEEPVDPAVEASMEAMKGKATEEVPVVEEVEEVEEAEVVVDQEAQAEEQPETPARKVVTVGKRGNKATDAKPEDDQTVTV